MLGVSRGTIYHVRADQRKGWLITLGWLTKFAEGTLVGGRTPADTIFATMVEP